MSASDGGASRGGADATKKKPRRGKSPEMSAKMAGRSQRTYHERECDLAFIATRMARGLNVYSISQELAATRPYSLSMTQLRREVAIVLDRWKEAAKTSISEQKAIALAKIEEIEARAWKRIEALESGQSRTSTTVTSLAYTKPAKEGEPPTPQATVRKNTIKNHELSLGLWLRTLQWCVEQRAKIFGLYAPLKIDNKGGGMLAINGGGGNFTMNVNLNTQKSAEEIVASFPIIDVPPEEIEDGSADEP